MIFLQLFFCKIIFTTIFIILLLCFFNKKRYTCVTECDSNNENMGLFGNIILIMLFVFFGNICK